jgi:hypothetical protein
MYSSSNQGLSITDRLRSASLRIGLPAQKRPIHDLSHDDDSEADIQREKSHRMDYFLEAPLPSETQFSLDDPSPDATSTAAAADPTPNGDQHPFLPSDGVVFDYYKASLTTILEYYLRQYRSSRYELRRRTVSLSVLENHQTRGTFPSDLDFKLGVANPYRNIHSNRNELLQREQQIIQEAKSQILQCRIEAANSAVLEQQQMIETKFFVQQTGSFTSYLKEKVKSLFPAEIQLPPNPDHPFRKTWRETQLLYTIRMAEQKNSLDAKFAALDAKRDEGLKKTSKSVPLVHTLNESDFQTKLIQALKGVVEEHTKRPRKKPAEPSSAPPPSSSSPAADSGTEKRRNRRKSQKKQPPSSEAPAQTKQGTSKRRSYSSVTSSAPPSAPPAAPPSSTRRPSSAPTAAKTTSSSSHRHVSFTDDMSVDENDGSWTQVRHHKNRRSGKNAQAQDKRDVPKQNQVRHR